MSIFPCFVCVLLFACSVFLLPSVIQARYIQLPPATLILRTYVLCANFQYQFGLIYVFRIFFKTPVIRDSSFLLRRFPFVECSQCDLLLPGCFHISACLFCEYVVSLRYLV